jgi:hypothetical protein
MKKKLVHLALVVAAAYHLRAETVETYQRLKADSKSVEAQLDQIYIKGLGEGLQLANVRVLMDSVLNKSPMMLFCPPQNLALNESNFFSIIDSEIERRLRLAADNSDAIKVVMQTDIRILLLYGLKNTFPCSPALIRAEMDRLAEQLQSVKPK